MRLLLSAVVLVSLSGVTALPGLGADTLVTPGHDVRLSAQLSSSSAASCSTNPSPTLYVSNDALDAVQFVSSTTGWVAGANRILHTTDAGAHWSVQLQQAALDLVEVDAIDSSHVWAVGRDVVLATSNGGQTWRHLPEPCAELTAVHFVSPSRGFGVAGGRLLRTSDGGRKWTRVTAPSAAQSVCFTTSQRGWLGAHGKVYRTVDGGRTWTLAVAGAHPHATRNYPVALVECAGTDAGWAELVGPGVGASQEEHVAYHLSDAGATAIFAEQQFQGPHSTIKRNSPGAYFAAFSSVDPMTAVFVDTCAPCGMGTSPVAVATDAGRHLAKAGNVRHVNNAFGAGYISSTNGWVVGSVNHLKGRPTWKIVHTMDGGRHWTTQYVE